MGASKLVILKGGQGLRYGKSTPPFSTFTLRKERGKISKGGKGMRQIFTGELN